MKEKTKKEIKAWLFIVSLNVIVMGACLYDMTKVPVVQNEAVESEEDVIHWKTEDTIEEQEEVTIEPNELEVTIDYVGVRFFNVPLSKELQYYTFMECDGYDIAPAIVLAIMDAESDYDVNALSKYGDIGIMQISPIWQRERMERLGCNDLYDPYQNIKVGIDYLAWLKDINPDICWVLMAYNEGPDDATENMEQGYISDYALEVLEIGLFVTLYNKCEWFRDGVNDIFIKIKSGITGITDTTGGVIDAIKYMFGQFKNIKIPTPHFKINGEFSLNPPSIPEFSFSWYAKGGILNSPTIFGMNGNSFLGGGEAGPEAVLPIELLRQYIREENAANNSMLIELIREAISEVQFVAENNIFIGDKKIETILTEMVLKKISEKMSGNMRVQGVKV